MRVEYVFANNASFFVLLLLRVETINFNFLYIVSKLSPSKNILRLANVCEKLM